MYFIKSLRYPEKQDQLTYNMKSIFNSGQYTEGQFTAHVEKLLSEKDESQWTLMNSCGSALYGVFRYYKAEGHRKIVMQNNTFHATGSMALEAGFEVSLCDSGVSCPSMGADSMIEVLKKTNASVVCLTHVGGWVAKDYLEISNHCKSKNIVLIEDCAHAFGVEGPGSLGDASTWSWYSTKAVPAGDSGACSTKNEKLHKYMQQFRSYGKIQFRENGPVFYEKEGFNLRISEYTAAVLLVQLEHLPKILERRKADAVMLQSIAPCLLTGPSNYYKYPVKKDAAVGLHSVGKVYALTDQLGYTLSGRVNTPVPLPHSLAWATDHACLPVGEGLYEGWEVRDVKERLHL